MKHLRTWTAVLAAAVLLLTPASSAVPAEGAAKVQDTYLLKGESKKEMSHPIELLDVTGTYKKLTYIPEMFYGNYDLDEAHKKGQFKKDSKAAKDFLAKTEKVSLTLKEGSAPEEVTCLPFSIRAGARTLSHVITRADSHDWMQWNVLDTAGNLKTVLGAYTVGKNASGENILSFRPLEMFEYDKETDHLRYKLQETALTASFAFKGPYLTLTSGGSSVTLTASEYMENKMSGGHEFLFNNYASSEPLIDGGLTHMYMRCDSPKKSSVDFIMGTAEGDTHMKNCMMELKRDGLMTICYDGPDGKTVSRQYVWFDGCLDGFVLADGTNTYCFNYEFPGGSDAKGLSWEEVSDLEDATEEEAETALAKRRSLLEALEKAFRDAELPVAVDRDTGVIALDSAVLFPTDVSELSSEGRDFLRQFLGIYASVVFSDEYDGFVSKILIEGHTDDTGSYEYNLDLSQKRADAVLAFSSSADSGLSAGELASFAAIARAEGRSYDVPVLGADGTIDRDASRRVSFCFSISVKPD